MNANELADALQETEPYYSTDYKLFDKASTMLRQQQAEIDALKNFIAKSNALDKKLHESMQKVNEVWGNETKSILKKAKGNV